MSMLTMRTISMSMTVLPCLVCRTSTFIAICPCATAMRIFRMRIIGTVTQAAALVIGGQLAAPDSKGTSSFSLDQSRCPSLIRLPSLATSLLFATNFFPSTVSNVSPFFR